MRLFFMLFCCRSSDGHAQLLIKNTNVIDIEKEKIIPGQNVLVIDGKIMAVDKDRSYKLPEGTTILEGEGQSLVPGLPTPMSISFKVAEAMPVLMPLTCANTVATKKRSVDHIPL